MFNKARSLIWLLKRFVNFVLLKNIRKGKEWCRREHLNLHNAGSEHLNLHTAGWNVVISDKVKEYLLSSVNRKYTFSEKPFYYQYKILMMYHKNWYSVTIQSNYRKGFPNKS